MSFGRKYDFNFRRADPALFAGALTRLEGLLADPMANDKFARAIYPALMDTDSIKKFFLWFLARDITRELNRYKGGQPVSMPKELGEFTMTRRFRQAQRKLKGPDNPTRIRDTHTLSKTAYNIAASKIASNPLLADTVLVMEMGMRNYLGCLEHAVNVHFAATAERAALYEPFRDDILRSLLFLDEETRKNSFLEEMLPFLASALPRQRDSYASEQVGRVFGKGLIAGVRRADLFRSAAEDGTVKVCPFSSAVIPLAYMKPVARTKSAALVEGDSKNSSGSLFAFIHEKLRLKAVPRLKKSPRPAP